MTRSRPQACLAENIRRGACHWPPGGAAAPFDLAPRHAPGVERRLVPEIGGFTITRLCLVLLVVVLAAEPALAATSVFDPVDYGARPDGRTAATAAIQKAPRCLCRRRWRHRAAGPGHIPLRHAPSEEPRDAVPGSRLYPVGHADPKDYPEITTKIRSYTDNYVCQSLIAGEGLEQVAIRGQGTINGQGTKFYRKKEDYKNRPFLIRLVDCRDVLVEDIHLRDSAMWMQHYLACERVRLRGVTVFNHAAHNSDGVDIDGCRDVTISDCMFDTDDDALCLKSSLPRPCENVTVSNCVLSSHCSAIKAGTESNGGFKNVTITNCTVCSPRHTKAINGVQRGLCGIALEIVDGGQLENVAISNIMIDGVASPIHLAPGNCGRPHQNGLPKPPVGSFRNVVLSNITATRGSKRLRNRRHPRPRDRERHVEQRSPGVRGWRDSGGRLSGHPRTGGMVSGYPDVRPAAGVRIVSPPR